MFCDSKQNLSGSISSHIKILVNLELFGSYHISPICIHTIASYDKFKHYIQLTYSTATANFTLMCAIHVCVVQFYSSGLLELTCHMRVRVLMLYLSLSQVLHASYTLCILHGSKILCVKSGVLYKNKTWQVQSYSTLLYCIVILVY